ncbi:hypothetical protein JCM6882_000146 [Rhodosporidiobolus microsporus]
MSPPAALRLPGDQSAAATPSSSTRSSPHRPPGAPRGPSLLTGSTSGSATPSTSYGSFPPMDGPTPAAAGEVEQILRRKLSQSDVQGTRRGELRHERRWERSRERLLRPGRDGKQGEDVYDSDGDAQSDGEPLASGAGAGGGAGEGTDDSGDDVWNAGDAERSGWTDSVRSKRSKRSTRSGMVEPEGDKQWGVVKMELMSRTWGRRGLWTIYAGVYLISALTSLEGNTTPTVEPYFLSLLGEHSMLSGVVIVTSIAWAVGKPPMTKILDVFGRAEGICLAAVLYSLGYLITAAATDVRVYVFARAVSALGAQGIQLAQQIIIADTTTLANRGLITSTISLPFLLTTWIGPPLGAFFQRQGPAGYRAAYATFGILLPLIALVLFCTLCLEWRKLRRKALREGRTPSTRDLGFGIVNRASWAGHSPHHHHHHHHSMTSSVGSSPRKERHPIPSSLRSSLDRPRPASDPFPHPYVSPPVDPDAAENGDGLLSRERAEEEAAADAARELNRRKRWNKSTWDKAKDMWRELDVVGLCALTAGCVLFLLPFTLASKSPESWGDPIGFLLVSIGAAILIFFGWYEAKVATIPLLPPRLLRNPTLLGGSLMGFFHFVSQYCYESFFTSFLQVARGHSPQDASYIGQSYMFSACISAIMAGSLAKISNRYKWIGIVGILVHAGGVWLMMRTRNLNGSTFELVVSQIIGGIGGGFTTISVQIGCQGVVSHQDLAIATAIFLTITSIGGAVGGSIAGAVWSSILPNALAKHLPSSEHHHIPEIVASLPYALSFPMGTDNRTAINMAYVDVQRVLNWLALAFLGPGLVSMCVMKDVNLSKDDPGSGEGVVVLGRASFLAVEEDLTSASEESSLLGNTSERD